MPLLSCIIDATVLFMITDKETIGETNSYQKERKVADVRHKIRGGKKTRTSFVAGLVLINLFVAIMLCPPSRDIFVCGPDVKLI